MNNVGSDSESSVACKLQAINFFLSGSWTKVKSFLLIIFEFNDRKA